MADCFDWFLQVMLSELPLSLGLCTLIDPSLLTYYLLYFHLSPSYAVMGSRKID